MSRSGRPGECMVAAGLALVMGWHAVGAVFCRSRFNAAGIRLWQLQMLSLEIGFCMFEYELCRMGCSVNSVLQEP